MCDLTCKIELQNTYSILYGNYQCNITTEHWQGNTNIINILNFNIF